MSAGRDETVLPLGNMRFRVSVEGLAESRAFEVVLPEARITRARGGARVAYGPLIVRRALTQCGAWYAWWDAARREARVSPRRVQVVLGDAAGRDARRWLYGGAVPVAYQLSPLHALGDQPVIESLELEVASFELEAAQERGRRSRVKAKGPV